MSWVPLHVHSCYSLLDGLSQPRRIAQRLLQCKHTACALTDHGSVSGVVAFQKALKDTCKSCGQHRSLHPNEGVCMVEGSNCSGFETSGIKPILGCEFNVCRQHATVQTDENRHLSHLVVLAKNVEGWRRLMKAVSSSHLPEHSDQKTPRLSLEQLAELSGGHWLVMTGHPGSTLADLLFGEQWAEAYKARAYEQARTFVRSDWREAVTQEVARLADFFGRDNLALETQVIDQANLPASLVATRVWRHLAPGLGVRLVATGDSHYPRQDDARDHRVLLSCKVNATLAEIHSCRRLEDGKGMGLSHFFRSSNYHMPSTEEMAALHPQAELEAAVEMASLCEKYDITNPPQMPTYICPDGVHQNDQLRLLCERGLEEHVRKGDIELRLLPEYRQRLEREMEVLLEADLAGYFLIVQDMIAWARSQGYKTGIGRGSVGGSLVAFLCGITRLDPIPNDLIFERFYSAARNTPAHVDFPDLPFGKVEPGRATAQEVWEHLMPGRVVELDGDPHYAAEQALLRSPRVAHYYLQVLTNPTLDTTNPTNSRILWASGRVRGLDRSAPVKMKPAKASLPDIDSDFPPTAREPIFHYLREKYGEAHVCQMATFVGLQGKAALKEVLRAHGRMSAEEMNRVTAPLPEPAAIADHLQEMREETGEASVLQWALENIPDQLSDWCRLNDKGELEGPLAADFAQAMRLEGCKKTMSKHPAGVVLSSLDLASHCPMAFDKNTKALYAAFDMHDMEALGHVKFDVLGTAYISKVQLAEELVREGPCQERFPFHAAQRRAS